MQTKIILRLLAFICLMLLVAPSHAMRTVSVPLQDYLNDDQLSRLTKDDSIYKLAVDLNDDGVDDIFYSSTAPGDKASRRGAKVWVPYISTPQGYQAGDFVDMNNLTVSLQRLANGKLALMYLSPDRQNSGIYYAFYVDEENRLRKKVISHLNNGEESERSMAITPVDESAQLLQEQTIPLSEIASPEQLLLTFDETQAFNYKKEMRRDYDTSSLIYFYTEDLSEFLGIQELSQPSIIPVETIEEPIRTLIKKRAMARTKGIRMDSEQDKTDYNSIMTWFEAWHEQYGALNRMSREIAEMSEEERQKILSTLGVESQE